MPIFAMSKEKRKKIWRSMQDALPYKSRRAKCSPTQRNETTGTKQGRGFLQRAKLSCLLGEKIDR